MRASASGSALPSRMLPVHRGYSFWQATGQPSSPCRQGDREFVPKLTAYWPVTVQPVAAHGQCVLAVSPRFGLAAWRPNWGVAAPKIPYFSMMIASALRQSLTVLRLGGSRFSCSSVTPSLTASASAFPTSWTFGLRLERSKSHALRFKLYELYFGSL